MNKIEIGMVGRLNHNLSENECFLFAPGDKVRVLDYNPDFYAGWGNPEDALTDEGPVALVLVRVDVEGGIDVWMQPDKLILADGVETEAWTEAQIWEHEYSIWCLHCKRPNPDCVCHLLGEAKCSCGQFWGDCTCSIEALDY